MRKILSVLCAVALLATCIISVPASASTEPWTEPVTVTITGAGEDVTATYPGSDEVDYDHQMFIPEGWGWKAIEEHKDLAKASWGTLTRSSLWQSGGATLVIMRSGDVQITKTVDVTPGYKYTVSTRAYKVYGKTAAQMEIWLMHKTADGKYIPINDYLATISDHQLTEAEMHYVEKREQSAEIDGSEYQNANQFDYWDMSKEITVDDPNVNAIMVGLGGGYNAPSTQTGINAFTVTQGTTVDLDDDYTTYYYKGAVPATYETVNTKLGANSDLDYSFSVPTDWEWVNTRTATDATQGVERPRAEVATVQGVNYIRMTGSEIAITKMVDIDPGYTYTVTSETFSNSANYYTTRPSLSYEFYHKNDDGTYTQINDYLDSVYAASVNAFGSVSKAYATSNKGDMDTAGGITTAPEGSGFAAAYTLSLTFSITDSNIDAVRIGVGGYPDNVGNSATHSNYAVYHKGFTVTQGTPVDLVPNTTYFYKTGISSEYTTQTVTYTDKNSAAHSHFIYIPNGWDYKITEGTNAAEEAARYRSKIETKADGLTYLGMCGAELAITKTFDVQPGYTYAIDADFYSTLSGSRGSVEYWLMHKNADGTYTPINEYLTENNYENTVATDFEVASSGNMGNYTAVEWDGSDTAYKYSATFNVEVTDPNVNAIMVGLGGYSSQGPHNNYRVWHDGFRVTKGTSIGIVANDILYDSEKFTSNYVEKEVTLTGRGDYSDVTYTATHKVPSADWTVESATDTVKDYHLSSYISADNKIELSTTSATKEPFYLINGSAMDLVKYVTVEPGYNYSLVVDATRYPGGSTATGHVTFYHKNADGTYTPINTYLTNMGYTTAALTDYYFKAENTSTDVVSKRWSSGFVDCPVTVNFSVTDPSVNAIRIGMGSIVSTEQWASKSTYYFGYTLKQTGRVAISDNKRPVSVTYTSNNDTIATAALNLTGAGEISLRPVTSTVDPSVNVVSNTGYFKGWQIGTKTYTSEEGKKAPIGAEDKTLTLNALWYAESELVNDAISSAAAQAVTLSGGDTAIRFLALVGEDYEDYAEAGFVITTLAENPTVEAGYIPNGFDTLYRSVKVGTESWSVDNQSILAKFEYANTMVPTGITYANVVVTNGATTYYATPYVKTQNGEIIYGKTKAASYAGLAALDAQ